MLQNCLSSCFSCCEIKEKDANTTGEEPTESSRLLQDKEGSDEHNSQTYGTQNDQPEYSNREVHAVHAARHHLNTVTQTVKELNAIADRLEQTAAMFNPTSPKPKRKRRRICF
ncbi:uncharacterized protein LOC134272646 [Saccostrea cucullata]|uniref:uncharacterized protein LOC134272646 n=1 Tax=Saccostrea cuccullata TaxID=36930 RepID=UPI002ED3FBE0